MSNWKPNGDVWRLWGPTRFSLPVRPNLFGVFSQVSQNWHISSPYFPDVIQKMPFLEAFSDQNRLKLIHNLTNFEWKVSFLSQYCSQKSHANSILTVFLNQPSKSSNMTQFQPSSCNIPCFSPFNLLLTMLWKMHPNRSFNQTSIEILCILKSKSMRKRPFHGHHNIFI